MKIIDKKCREQWQRVVFILKGVENDEDVDKISDILSLFFVLFVESSNIFTQMMKIIDKIVDNDEDKDPPI